MSALDILPSDARWIEPKRLVSRETITIPDVRSGSPSGCQSPPGPDALRLTFDGTSSQPASATLNFTGSGFTLFGAKPGSPSISYRLDVPPSSPLPSSTSTSPTGGTAAEPSASLSACDFILAEIHGLPERDHTLYIDLQSDGQVFIYNATLDSTSTSTAVVTSSSPVVTPTQISSAMPSSTTARLPAAAIALPLSAIAVIAVIFVTVWLRRRRRKARRQATPLIRPYGQSLSASSPVDSLSSSSVVHEGKRPLSSKEALSIPDATKISVSVGTNASDAGNLGTPRNAHERIPTSTMGETGLADLSRAVEQAGFSLDALVTSLRLVHHSALQERETESPPMYDGR